MPYKLLPSNEDDSLFFRMDEETAERHGAIGYLRIDFGKTGREFWSTWFDIQPQLNSYGFKTELDSLINSLRDDGREPPFASRKHLAKFCVWKPGKDLSGRGHGYRIRTQNYSYYFRCLSCPGDYDVYCFAYDNRWLLHELAEKHNKGLENIE